MSCRTTLVRQRFKRRAFAAPNQIHKLYLCILAGLRSREEQRGDTRIILHYGVCAQPRSQGLLLF